MQRLLILLIATLFVAGSWLPASGQTPATPAASATPATATTKPAESTDAAKTSSVTEPPSADGGLGTVAQREARRNKLNEALKVLIAEANAIEEVDNPKIPIYWTRPHPMLKTWTDDMAVACLDRMQQPFTRGEGAIYRDTYIRWHLMAVVKLARQKDKQETGPRLMALVKKLPGSLKIKWRTEYYHEPEKIYQKWAGLASSGNRVTGYKPFERVVGPPESYALMSPAEAAKVKSNLAEAEKLAKQFTTRVDKNAIAFNSRARQLNYIIRQYRGELLYSLILTGDPATAKAVMSEIRTKVNENNPVAFDLLAYFYLATFDGALNLYDQSTLNELSAELKSFSAKNQQYEMYGGAKRNFAQYAFHLIYMLEDGGGFIDPKDVKTIPNSRRRNRNRG